MTTVELQNIDLNAQGGVHCPSRLAGMQIWNTHPKIFLDVASSGAAKCPYCGTQYVLAAGQQPASHAH